VLLTTLVPALVANVILALPVHRLVRLVVGEEIRSEPARDVEVVV
jgi:hypothetical protein